MVVPVGLNRTRERTRHAYSRQLWMAPCLSSVHMVVQCAMALVSALPAAGDEEVEIPPIRVIAADADGRPLANAEVGIDANFGTLNDNLIRSQDGWGFVRLAMTDSTGTALIRNVDSLPVFVVARDARRELVAVTRIESGYGGEPVDLQLTRAFTLKGTVTCDDLEKIDRPRPRVSVELRQHGVRVASYFSRDGAFTFAVPKGEYTLRCYGDLTRRIEKSVEVSTENLDVGTIDLPASGFALLQGQIAPGFRDVLSWKNGGPYQPEDFRGQYLLIDFWGHWCGPCLDNMPGLMDLHSKYHDKGLVIIGIHVDNGDGVDSVAELNSRLSAARENLWGGKDIPFPVALVSLDRVSGPGRNDEDARCALSAAYGVTSYPTTILVDREGRIVERINSDNPKHVQKLVELLEHSPRDGD